MTHPCFLGIDTGTSGMRACVIDDCGQPLFEASRPWPEPVKNGDCCEADARLWARALFDLLAETARRLPASFELAALAIDGTSAALTRVIVRTQA